MTQPKILIGTSGYSYEDWRGYYYPVRLAKRDLLAFYAQEFSFTEINSTYYQLPGIRMMEGLAGKTPADFVFAVKAYQSLTHQRQGQIEEDARRFISSLTPLQQQGKLGAVLFQFPYSFRCREDSRQYLVRLKELFQDLPIIAEFRHYSWDQPPVWEFLRQLGLGYTCVDEPQLKGLIKPRAVRTSPLAYVRFHGRNAAKWWQHQHPFERYDYLYSKDELQQWIPRIRQLEAGAERVFVAFNNHYRGQAVQNARMLREMLNS